MCIPYCVPQCTVYTRHTSMMSPGVFRDVAPCLRSFMELCFFFLSFFLQASRAAVPAVIAVVTLSGWHHHVPVVPPPVQKPAMRISLCAAEQINSHTPHETSGDHVFTAAAAVVQSLAYLCQNRLRRKTSDRHVSSSIQTKHGKGEVGGSLLLMKTTMWNHHSCRVSFDATRPQKILTHPGEGGRPSSTEVQLQKEKSAKKK